ncbi:MAG: aspartate aminotransferase family protein [Solirubrobacteraceae bacterium]
MTAHVTDTGRDSLKTRFWHPFADMGAVKSAEFVVTRAQDVWLWDAAGRRYLDATASLWYANVGHGRPEIAQAVAAQMAQLETYSAFGDFANPPALELCERIAALAPVPGARVFLGSGGGDGIEAAAKLARRYWSAVGSPERTHILSRTGAYHGTHGYGTALAGIDPNREGFGELAPDASQVDRDSVGVLEAEIERIGPERVAAFFMEPVIGAGGVYPPPPGYIEAVADLCRRTGVLLVIDAVICAFGRLGTWFAIDRWGVEPDMIVFAKGVTSGYLPLGGAIVSERVAEPFWSGPGSPVFRHGATYAGHASCCAAALANLDLLEHDNLLARGRELESDLLRALAPLAEHPLVCEVRGGVGTMAAVELDAELLARRPRAVQDTFLATRGEGVLVRPLGTSLAVSPPLTATPEHFKLVAQALSSALESLGA